LGSALVASEPTDSPAHPVFHDQMLIVLHGFIKKTKKTPADDLALAKRRMKEVTK
jgi:phage-related protein